MSPKKKRVSKKPYVNVYVIKQKQLHAKAIFFTKWNENARKVTNSSDETCPSQNVSRTAQDLPSADEVNLSNSFDELDISKTAVLEKSEDTNFPSQTHSLSYDAPAQNKLRKEI